MVKTAFLGALACLASMGGAAATASAQETQRASAPSARFQRADADRSGDISPTEFAGANDRQVIAADADGDGRMTLAEITDEVMRARAERIAQRIVKRFDRDGDGAVTRAEVEARQKLRFERLDKNGDGKLTPDEMSAARRAPGNR